MKMADSVAILIVAVILLLSPQLSHQIQIQIQIHAPCTNNNNADRHHQLTCQVQSAKVTIARLESVVEENLRNSEGKSRYIEKCRRLIVENDKEIEDLKSHLLLLKNKEEEEDSLKRIEILQEEVRLLWDVLRKNNFDLHKLEIKARDTESRVEVVSSRVHTMADIVTEQWIQIQKFEQALQIAQIRTLKVKRQLRFKRCTFLKFINNLYVDHLEQLIGLINPYLHRMSAPGSYLSGVLHQLKSLFSAAKYYHHQLQVYVKQEMKRNELTAAFANNEVIFFMASAVIAFPILTAWMFLMS